MSSIYVHFCWFRKTQNFHSITMKFELLSRVVLFCHVGFAAPNFFRRNWPHSHIKYVSTHAIQNQQMNMNTKHAKHPKMKYVRHSKCRSSSAVFCQVALDPKEMFMLNFMTCCEQSVSFRPPVQFQQHLCRARQQTAQRLCCLDEFCKTVAVRRAASYGCNSFSDDLEPT